MGDGEKRKEEKKKKKRKRKVTGDVVIGFSPARAGAGGAGGTFPNLFSSQRHSSARLVPYLGNS